MFNNVFDRMQDRTFDIISNTMGYEAKRVDAAGNDMTWPGADGQPKTTARVLYKYPTETTNLADLDYEPNDYSIEYKQGDFIGLREAVKSNVTVYVRVYIGTVWVKHRVLRMEAKYDGKTIVAVLTPPL